MNYYSLHRKAPSTGFKEAVIKGLAPDKGLYFPEKITSLSEDFFDTLDNMSHLEIAFEVIKQFVGDAIPEPVLKSIIKDTLTFDFPLIELNNHISILELFHGPTMAFKDVGARFMARCLGYFNRNNADKVTVLVATSGDTGGAVANGFLGVKGVNVIILYPSGKVSEIQEKQLTTLGQNIIALEVEGVFDDCQDMVKRAFVDEALSKQLRLTSANSINIARWLPQMFYYFFAYKALKNKYHNLVFCVPSGNYGNICAGMVAQKLGLPVNHFIAANNSNDTVVRYMDTKTYNPKPSIPTVSNAMDVGNPSNFIRIQELYSSFEDLKYNLSSYSFSDEETISAITELYKGFGYIADPHGAVGYLGAKSYLEKDTNSHVVVLETAHPTKFLDIVEDVIQKKVAIPKQIQGILNKTKSSTKISSYKELKSFLLNA